MWVTRHIFWLSGTEGWSEHTGNGTNEILTFNGSYCVEYDKLCCRLLLLWMTLWLSSNSFYILPFHTSTLQVFTCKRRDFAHWAETQPFKWLLVNKRTSLLFPKCNQFAYVLKRHQAVATLQRPSSNVPPSRTEYPDTHAHIPCAFSASRLLKHTHTHTLPDMNDKMRR